MNGHERQEERDVALRAALREASPAPPHDSVDWAALYGRITADAVPVLERHRAGRAGRVPPLLVTLAAWSRRAIPATAAAAAVTLLVLGSGVPRRVQDAGAVAFVTVEEELAGSLFDGSAPVLSAGYDDDALLESLLLYDGGVR